MIRQYTSYKFIHYKMFGIFCEILYPSHLINNFMHDKLICSGCVLFSLMEEKKK